MKTIRNLLNHLRFLYEYVRRGEPELILGHFRSEENRAADWKRLLDSRNTEITPFFPTFVDLDKKIGAFDLRHGTNFGLIFREQFLNHGDGFPEAVESACQRAKNSGAIDADVLEKDMIAEILHVRHFRL